METKTGLCRAYSVKFPYYYFLLSAETLFIYIKQMTSSFWWDSIHNIVIIDIPCTR